MKKNIIKKSIKLIFTLVLLGIIFSFAYASYEAILANNMINSFKKRGTHLEIYDHSFKSGDLTIYRKFYSVSRETSFEKDGRNVISNLDTMVFKNELPKLASKGDIYTARQSPFPDLFLIDELMSLYYGGHAALYDGEGRVIEAFGFPDNLLDIIKFILHDPDEPNIYDGIGVGKQSSDYWIRTHNVDYKSTFNAYYDRYYKSNFQIIRVKQNNESLDDETITNVIDYANELAENNYIYNFLFFLDMKNKYYCTDLVSRAYDYILSGTKDNYYSKSLNDDGFITTVNDLIISKDTYIALHFEVSRIGSTELVEKYYFLEQV